MAESTFAIPLGLAELVIPLVSVGVFVPGFFLFAYMLRRSPQDVYARTFIMTTLGFVHVATESLIILLGGVLHLQAVSMQVSRIQQVGVSWLIPAIPYYLGSVMTGTNQFPKMNRAMTVIGIGIAAATTLVAFAAPDLFRSVTVPHALAAEIESAFGRGARGPLTGYRDLLLFSVLIYSNVVVVLEVITNRVTRFSLTLMIGLQLTLLFSIMSLVDSIVGPLPGIYPRSTVGITLFALASMLAATWRFIDQARAVESANTALQSQEKRLAYLAYHDQLTGTRNRKAFFEVLAGRSQSARSGAGPGLALLYMDLDHFKEVNDTYGHRTGDQVLKRVAEQLQASIRQTDALFRIGGDEFALVVETASDGVELQTIADKLLDGFRKPIQADGREFKLGLSMGAAIIPAHARTVEDLVTRADRALYAAKKNRNTFRLYGRDMDPAKSPSIEVIDELRAALESRTLGVHYQAVSRADGSVCGLEALLRWRRARDHRVSAGALVDLAEAAGLMPAIGELVMDIALRETAPLLDSGIIEHLSFNVSGRQIAEDGFAEGVQEAAARFGVPLSRLRFEIREIGPVDPFPLADGRLTAGGNDGMRFTVDDFGNAYSSLACLRHPEVTSLKLDRQLVQAVERDTEAQAFLRGLMAMIGEMDVSVVAKGVENERQKAILEEAGCTLFQGFLWGRPGPIDSVIG